MANELEEFLRRAAERRAAQKSGAPSPPPPTMNRPAPTDRSPPPNRPLQANRPLPDPPKAKVRTLVAEVVPAELVTDVVPLDPVSGDDVAAHVAKHLDTGAFNRRAQSMGERAGRADDEMEAHLHQAFDHRLGQLAGGTTAITAETSPASGSFEVTRPGTRPMVDELVAMLRQPATIRQAILLNEILSRPEGRW